LPINKLETASGLKLLFTLAALLLADDGGGGFLSCGAWFSFLCKLMNLRFQFGIVTKNQSWGSKNSADCFTVAGVYTFLLVCQILGIILLDANNARLGLGIIVEE
jgi:hypothetical protein